MRCPTVCSILAAALSSGCVSTFFKSADDAARAKDYRIAAPPGAWSPTDPGGGDSAWRSTADGAVIGVDSVCGQERDKSLKELTRSALVGLGVTGAPRTERALTIDGKPALQSTTQGDFDGKAYELTLTVIRGRFCVYDVTLARDAKAPDHAADYQKVLASFSTTEAH